jgi:hypothetical protein
MMTGFAMLNPSYELYSPPRFRLQLGPSAFPNIKQLTLFPKNHRGKKSSQSFYEIIPFRERRASHADQTRDLRWFDGRPGFAGSAGAGQTFRYSEDQRTID